VALSISAVVLLAIVVFLLIRKSGLKAGHAAVCALVHRPVDQHAHHERGGHDRRTQVLTSRTDRGPAS
jgi:hypothetical protein